MRRRFAMVALAVLTALAATGCDDVEGVVTGRYTTTTWITVGKVRTMQTTYYLRVRADGGPTVSVVTTAGLYIACSDGERYPECAR